MPLITRHHKELAGFNASPARLAELRARYAGDGIAQQQLDVYDANSPYHQHHRLFASALKRNDSATVAAEHQWLQDHYPAIR